jgi:hypothetical protein
MVRFFLNKDFVKEGKLKLVVESYNLFEDMGFFNAIEKFVDWEFG